MWQVVVQLQNRLPGLFRLGSKQGSDQPDIHPDIHGGSTAVWTHLLVALDCPGTDSLYQRCVQTNTWDGQVAHGLPPATATYLYVRILHILVVWVEEIRGSVASGHSQPWEVSVAPTEGLRLVQRGRHAGW